MSILWVIAESVYYSLKFFFLKHYCLLIIFNKFQETFDYLNLANKFKN